MDVQAIGAWLVILASEQRTHFAIVLTNDEGLLNQRAGEMATTLGGVHPGEVYAASFLPMDAIPCFVLGGPRCAVVFVPYPDAPSGPSSGVILQ